MLPKRNISYLLQCDVVFEKNSKTSKNLPGVQYPLKMVQSANIYYITKNLIVFMITRDMLSVFKT